jgi:1,2-dihydroxy-3-keto-5-methylthiopentene dioxygenase
MRLTWLEPSTPGEDIDLGELARVGVLLERMDVHGDDFQPRLDALARDRGYVEQDVIELQPTTPNLDGICAKFADEHLHTDDEVRLIVGGEGIFDIRSVDDRWIRLVVEEGDLVVVPAHLHHRFFLTDRRSIRCVRLFKDASGWVPHYRALARENAS